MTALLRLCLLPFLVFGCRSVSPPENGLSSESKGPIPLSGRFGRTSESVGAACYFSEYFEMNPSGEFRWVWSACGRGEEVSGTVTLLGDKLTFSPNGNKGKKLWKEFHKPDTLRVRPFQDYLILLGEYNLASFEQSPNPALGYFQICSDKDKSQYCKEFGHL